MAIPVLDKEMLTHILKTDEQIPLKVVDVRNRKPIFKITYGDVWNKTDHEVEFDKKTCLKCDVCRVESICPVKAVHWNSETGLKFDRAKCFNCGLCVSRCNGGSFLAHLGSIELEGVNHKVPITLRQSNRVAALKAAQDLKQQIQKGQFKMTAPVGKISFPGSP